MYGVAIKMAGKDVTRDVSPYLSSFSYTDNVEDASDDVTLTFADVEHVWQQAWYPELGTTMEVELQPDAAAIKKYGMGSALKCGLFEVDEIELALCPDIMQVKALACPVSKGLRALNNKSFEKQTLRQIAEYFAKKHGLKMHGKASSLQQITIEKKEQKLQTDISFLCKTAKEYGVVFNIRGDQLWFVDIDELEAQPSAMSLQRSMLNAASFRDKITQVYQKIEYAHRSMRQNAVNKWSIEKGKNGSKDTIRLNKPAGSKGEAEQKSIYKIKEENREKITGNITMAGVVTLLAGVNVDIAGVGKFSGKWHVRSTTHSIGTDGYTTSADIYKIVQQ